MYESLSDGFDPWRSEFLEAGWKAERAITVYGAARHTERFALHDSEFLAGGYFALLPRWTLLLEGNVSPTHRVLPRHSELAQIETTLPMGFGVQAGLRHTQYDDAWSNLRNVTLERYWGNQSAGYTFYSGQVRGGGTPTSHRAQWRLFFADDSSAGLSYTTGVEVENLPGGTTVTSDVRTLVVSARHALSSAWALSFEWQRHEQGSSYVRNGVRLGLRRRF